MKCDALCSKLRWEITTGWSVALQHVHYNCETLAGGAMLLAGEKVKWYQDSIIMDLMGSDLSLRLMGERDNKGSWKGKNTAAGNGGWCLIWKCWGSKRWGVVGGKHEEWVGLLSMIWKIWMTQYWGNVTWILEVDKEKWQRSSYLDSQPYLGGRKQRQAKPARPADATWPLPSKTSSKLGV